MGISARTAGRLACGAAFAAAACNSLTGVSDLSVGDDSFDAAIPARGTDASAGPDGSPKADAAHDGPAGPPFCDPKEDKLLLCVTMEGAVVDQSKHQLQVSTATGVGFETGKVGLAGSFTDASVVVIPESDAMASTAFTIEAYVQPRSLPPAGGRAVIVDFDGRYSIAILPDGSLVCRGGNAVEIGAVTVPVGVWSHVACSEDMMGQAKIYLNGVPEITGSMTPISQTGNGAAIGMNAPAPSGDNFDGLVDEVRVWTVARSDADIAAAARR